MLDDVRKLPDGKVMLAPRKRRMLDRIEAERRSGGLSIETLCRRAQVTTRHYHRLMRGQSNGTSAMLRRLALGLRQDGDPTRSDVTRSLAFDGIVLKLQAVRAMTLPEARAQAIYIAHVELGLSQKQTADLAGVSKQFVGKVTQKLEDRRDSDRGFDEAITAIYIFYFQHNLHFPHTFYNSINRT